MSLDKAMKNMKFDKRLTEWALATGQISKEDMKKHLDSLPDLGGKIELINLSDEKHRQESH